MDYEENKNVSRREFLSWVTAAAAMVAIPGFGSGAAHASAQALGNLSGISLSDGVLQDGYLVFPDPPPPIINPSTTIVDVTPAHVYANRAPARQNMMLNASYRVPQQRQPMSPQPQEQQLYPPRQSPAPQQARQIPTPPPQQMPRVVPTAGGKVSAISRNTWGASPAVPGKMRAMNGVHRLTVHHEGSAKPNNETSPMAVAETLRLIQSQHRKRMGAGDIGYHFIIDRAGVIWQGRDWNFQGAHTSGENANNLGVMLLGNFEIQRPTQGQLQALHSLIISLVRKYRLNPGTDIFGHSDFCNTACPGKFLSPQVGILRRLGK